MLSSYFSSPSFALSNTINFYFYFHNKTFFFFLFFYTNVQNKMSVYKIFKTSCDKKRPRMKKKSPSRKSYTQTLDFQTRQKRAVRSVKFSRLSYRFYILLSKVQKATRKAVSLFLRFFFLLCRQMIWHIRSRMLKKKKNEKF